MFFKSKPEGESVNRRRALASTAAGLAAGFAGCSTFSTGSSDDPPTLPAGLSVETQRWDGCVLNDTPICSPVNRRVYNTVIPNRETAYNRLAEEAKVDTESEGFIKKRTSHSLTSSSSSTGCRKPRG